VGSVGQRVLLLGSSVAVALLLVETGLRMVPGLDRPRDGFVADLRGLHVAHADKPWLYGMRPGAQRRSEQAAGVTYIVNEDGFRDHPYARPKPSGTFRIVVLGDSVTFGFGVALEATFVKQLEALLVRAATMPIEVLSLGVSGYNA